MMKKSRVLVVEDEADVRDLMLVHLKREGFEAVGVESAEAAMAEGPSFDLLVLDWMLPGMSGLELCKRLGAKSGAPILMVTARADTADIVLGLEMGADDYITKPFEIPVFLARVRALLRRSQTQASAAATEGAKTGRRYVIGSLVLDLDRYQVECEGQEIQLTPSEFKLLSALMSHQGKVLSRDRLIELIQGQGVSVVDRAIDTHVFGLRKKLGPCADVIETIRGVGYRVQVG